MACVFEVGFGYSFLYLGEKKITNAVLSGLV